MASAIRAMGIFYGGIAQIIAGILEFKKGNTFGTTAFISYGSFWLTLVFIIVAKNVPGSSPEFMGWYLFLWGVFTFFMWFGTFRSNRVLQFVFFSLIVLFWLLAISEWFGAPTVGHIAGWEGLFCGAAALYLAMAEVINESRGKTVLPIGQPRSSL
jgi:succinate-acetate transporter protein